MVPVKLIVIFETSEVTANDPPTLSVDSSGTKSAPATIEPVTVPSMGPAENTPSP